MDERAQVTSLLTRAADSAGPFEPVEVADLTGRRRPRSGPRTLLAVAAVVLLVAGLAVGLKLAGSGDRTTTRPAERGISVEQLRHYHWSTLPKAPISTAHVRATVWTGKVLIVLGAGRTVASYDPTQRTWHTLARSPIGEDADFDTSANQAVWADGSVYAWTTELGYGMTGRALVFARYDLARNRWTWLDPPDPVDFGGSSQLVAVDGVPYVTGTSIDPKNRRVYVARFDARTSRWHRLPDLGVPHGDILPVALAAGDSLIVWAYWSDVKRLPGNTITETNGVETAELDTRGGRWLGVPFGPDKGQGTSTPIWTGDAVLLPEQDEFFNVSLSHPPGGRGPGLLIERSGERTQVPKAPPTTTFTNAGTVLYAWTGRALIAVDRESTTARAPGVEIENLYAWPVGTRGYVQLPSHPMAGATGVIWAGDRLIVTGSGTWAEFGP